MTNPSSPAVPNGARRGYTLIEVMIVVLVVGVIATVAVPSFLQQVRASRRSEAISQLALIQQAQERWRANQPSYATTLMTANPADCDTPAEQVTNSCLNIAAPSGARYTYALSSVGATGYTLTATPQGGQNQDRASGVSCNPLTVTVANGSPTFAPSACFRQ